MPTSVASSAQTAIDCGPAGSGPRCRRREPERAVLHGIVREHLASVLAEAADRYPCGDLPNFIRGKFGRSS